MNKCPFCHYHVEDFWKHYAECSKEFEQFCNDNNLFFDMAKKAAPCGQCRVLTTSVYKIRIKDTTAHIQTCRTSSGIVACSYICAKKLQFSESKNHVRAA